jgi:hypothetical protein
MFFYLVELFIYLVVELKIKMLMYIASQARNDGVSAGASLQLVPIYMDQITNLRQRTFSAILLCRFHFQFSILNSQLFIDSSIKFLCYV